MWSAIDRLGRWVIPSAKAQRTNSTSVTTPEQKRARDRLGLRIVCVPLLAVSLYLFGTVAWRSQFWTTAEATIVGTTWHKRDAEIRYRFVALGHGDTVGVARVGRRIAEQHVHRRPITVLYSPANPQRNVTTIEQNETGVLALLMTLGAGGALSIGFWCDRRAARQRRRRYPRRLPCRAMARAEAGRSATFCAIRTVGRGPGLSWEPGW